MSPDEMDRLIFEVLDGSADAGQREQLAAWLLADPVAFSTYCRCCEMDSALARIAKGRSSLAAVKSLDAPGVGHPSRVRTSLLVAVAAVWLLGMMLWLFRAPPVESLARIVSSPDALYRMLDGEGNAASAADLAAGTEVWLSQGRVELVFHDGVRAVIEAPAEWSVVDEKRVDLRRGVAWFEVPPAGVGFQVFSPELEVTDLGTEFGVLIEQGKNDEVHVFEGAVHARHRSAAPSNPPMRLTANQAASARPTRRLELIPVEEGRFSKSLPAILPHLKWSFAREEPQGFPTEGSHPALAEAFARPKGAPAIVADGPGGSALRLAPGQYLETDWPGILGSRARTVAGWIRIPADLSQAEIPSSIVFWGREGGTLSKMKWRVGINLEMFKEGGVKGALRTEFGLGYVIGSTDLRDGRWHHVASVFQGGNTGDNTSRILQYVDGEPEAHHAAVHQVIETETGSPLEFGGRGGRIDLADFIVVEGALTAEQISALARRQVPPSN